MLVPARHIRATRFVHLVPAPDRSKGPAEDGHVESHVDELIVEEKRHLRKVEKVARQEGPSRATEDAVTHAEEQVHRAVTIGQYEQILDAALRNLPPDVFFAEILGRIRTMLEADEATLYLLDDVGLSLHARASVGLEEAVQADLHIPVGLGVAGEVVTSQTTRTLQDINPDTVANPLLVEKGLHSLVTVAIPGAAEPIGVLEVGWTAKRDSDPQEVRLLEVVAERVGVAIERARLSPVEEPGSQRRLVRPLIDEERAHGQTLLKLARAGDVEGMLKEVHAHAERQTAAATTVGNYEAMRDAALGSLPMDERLALLLEGTRTLLASDVAAILLMDPEGNQLWPRASLGFQTSLGVKPVAVLGSIRKVVETNEALLVGDVQPDDEFRAGIAEEGIQSLVAVPIRVQGQVHGVLICGHRAKDRFGPRDLELLQLVADRMGVGFERGRFLESQVRDKRQAEQASRFKTDLLNMATHDLATPLTALGLQVHLMMDEAQSEDARKHSLSVMDRSLRRLSAMLGDFMDLARVEAGRMTIKPGQVDVGRLVHDAVEVFEAPAREKDLQLTIDGNAGLEAYGDERRIMQVLANLLSNAIRYSPDAGTIRIGATETPGHVAIHVQDEGLGLSPQQIPKLFRPFAQVQGVQAESQGTGLGLYLSKAIMDAHGGTLRLASPGPGKGTTATMTLPKAQRKAGLDEPATAP